MAVSRDGEEIVYVVDLGNDRIVMFDRDGNPTGSFVQTGEAPGQFRFNDSIFNDVAVGPDGSVYVGDYNQIQKLTPDGEPITAWGGFGGGDGQFNDPQHPSSLTPTATCTSSTPATSGYRSSTATALSSARSVAPTTPRAASTLP